MPIAGAAGGAADALTEILGEQMKRALLKQQQLEHAQKLQLERDQLAETQRRYDAEDARRAEANALKQREFDAEQAKAATDRNVGLDAANVMAMPGMSDADKANELLSSSLRNPKSSSTPTMLGIVQRLKTPKKEEVRDIKLADGTLLSLPKDAPAPQGTKFYVEPKGETSQAKPKIDIRTIGEAGPNGEPGSRVITFRDGETVSSQWIKGNASAGERQGMVNTDSSLSSLDTLHDAFDPSYVGPVAGRRKQIEQKIPGVKVDENAARFYAKSAAVRNAIIKAITGAQMSEPEARRITAQIPMPEDKPEVWQQKWEASKKNAEILDAAQRRMQGMKPVGSHGGDQHNGGDDIDALIERLRKPKG